MNGFMEQQSDSCTPISFWVVDDNEQYCIVLQEALRGNAEVKCQRIFHNGVDVLRALNEEKELPSVILLDISMPRLNGLEVLEQIRKKSLDISIIMLTVNEEEMNVRRALELGATGYILKTSSINDVINAILVASIGGMPMDPMIIRKIVKLFAATLKTPESYNLSSKEFEVLQLITEGMNDLEIANKLYISPHTVHTHIKSIFQKLDVHTRHELVAKAFREHLL